MHVVGYVVSRRTWLMLAVAVSMLPGCGSTGPTGPIDERLIGSWEYRFGLADTVIIDFKNDGTAKVTSKKGNSAPASYIARWYVQEKTKEGVNINMQAKGKATYELRKVKFIQADYIEMKFGSKMGRFQKLS